jgi:hypothetical protein
MEGRRGGGDFVRPADPHFNHGVHGNILLMEKITFRGTPPFVIFVPCARSFAFSPPPRLRTPASM